MIRLNAMHQRFISKSTWREYKIIVWHNPASILSLKNEFTLPYCMYITSRAITSRRQNFIASVFVRHIVTHVPPVVSVEDKCIPIREINHREIALISRLPSCCVVNANDQGESFSGDFRSSRYWIVGSVIFARARF